MTIGRTLLVMALGAGLLATAPVSAQEKEDRVLQGRAKFYNNRMAGEGPIALTMQISGAIQFDGRVHLLLRETGTQLTATQRVEISAGKAGGKIQEKSWTVPGTLKDSVMIERLKVVELEMPFQTDLAKIGGKPITLDFQQSQF